MHKFVEFKEMLFELRKLFSGCKLRKMQPKFNLISQRICFMQPKMIFLAMIRLNYTNNLVNSTKFCLS